MCLYLCVELSFNILPNNEKKNRFLVPFMIGYLQIGSVLSSVFGFPHRGWLIANSHSLGGSFGPLELRKVPPKILQLLVWGSVSLGMQLVGPGASYRCSQLSSD